MYVPLSPAMITIHVQMTNVTNWKVPPYFNNIHSLLMNHIIGCLFTPKNCDDGNACTKDICKGGQCYHTPKNCDDNNKCMFHITSLALTPCFLLSLSSSPLYSLFYSTSHWHQIIRHHRRLCGRAMYLRLDQLWRPQQVHHWFLRPGPGVHS